MDWAAMLSSATIGTFINELCFLMKDKLRSAKQSGIMDESSSSVINKVASLLANGDYDLLKSYLKGDRKRVPGTRLALKIDGQPLGDLIIECMDKISDSGRPKKEKREALSALGAFIKGWHIIERGE